MATCTLRKKRPFAAIRLRLGWDVNYASIRLNCHPSHLRALENSSKPLSQNFARKMARVYEVTLNELFITPAGAGGPETEGVAVSGNAVTPVAKPAPVTA